MQSFYDMPHESRFAVYDAIKSVECQTYPGGGSGRLFVSVAKGKFGALVEAMKPHGLRHVDLYTFPLGSDKPADRFRHDSRRYGVPACDWLIAVFQRD